MNIICQLYDEYLIFVTVTGEDKEGREEDLTERRQSEYSHRKAEACNGKLSSWVLVHIP